ncbi:MAG: lactate utilization protein [Clostridiales bacterium]|nr:lactate utilization protein [Clostridiales bacterium]
MDNNLKQVIEKRVYRTIKNLEKRSMNGYFIKNIDELYRTINNIIPDESIVSVGGSMTLFESGVIEYLRARNVKFLDRYADDLSKEDIEQIYRESFFADGYFASTNAITEEGEIYNVDGRGNRVAAMIYGPKKVILIVGTNKIVKNIDEAIERNKRISAPANVQRLNMDTPCHETGYCTNCNSPSKICNIYTVIDKQFDKDRIHVIFMDGSYGY